MLNIKKSGNPSIAPRPIDQGKAKNATLGCDLSGIKKKKKPGSSGEDYVSHSTMSSLPGMGPNVQVSNNPITIDTDPMLLGIISETEKSGIIYRLFRDMYYFDSVAGSAVDLISFLPFSEFTLGGLDNNNKLSTKVSQVYNENLERLNMRTFLPELSVDYLVLGTHLSSLLFNKEKRVFTDVMPHSIEKAKIEFLPFYSIDPIITVDFPDEVKAILAKKDSPRIKRIVDMIGRETVDKIIKGHIELDPLSTLFIPRKTFSSPGMGTSYFKRILPYYLIEKNLFRGTLVESARRQRGILHLTLGDGENWDPTLADMEFMTDLFANADSDPLGAIIATRNGVITEEIRQGGEFWKVSDYQDSVLAHKLRALGISESFLSGDSNWNTTEQGLTVFIDMIRSYRDMITRKVLYNKLFPMISLVNGFVMSNKKLTIRDGLADFVSPEEALFALNDGSKLFIPTVTWSKNLKPEGDSSYMDMLNSMSEKGVPVPLRILAAAGGLNLDELLNQKEEDLVLRKKLAEYAKQIAALTPKPEGGEGEEVSESSVAAAAAAALASSGYDSKMLPLLSSDPSGRHGSAVLASKGRVPLLNRDFGELGYASDKTKTGKPKHIINQRKANEVINKRILKAMKAAKNNGAYASSTTPKKGKTETTVI